VKVLIFAPIVAVWRPRLPTLLSVAQCHLDAGDEVVLVVCDRCVDACTANFDKARAICNYCIAKREQGAALLQGSFRTLRIHELIEPGLAAALHASEDDLSSVEALRELYYKNVDVGYAAFSTYAYVARKPEPNLANPTVRRVMQRLINASKLVFESAAAAIAAEAPDRVIVHHGRGPMDRSVLRASQAAHVDCWIYETAFSLNQLLCFRNALPHDIARFKERVDEQWASGSAERERIGAAFFEMRRSGKRTVEAEGRSLATQDRSFIRHQEAGLAPEGWDDTRKNVVIFGSSNDEFIAIGPEYEERIHPSQIDALSRLSADLAGENMHFYFRVHPRQKGVKDEYIEALLDLDRERSNVTVIPADSSISSYALLDRADVVVAFLSTMSIEATYWGKPSIIISASIYKPMGASYTPETHEELLALLRSDLEPLDRLPCLKFGYYQMTSGFEQRYYEGDLGKGRVGYTFRGNPVRIGGPTRWRYFWSRERQRLKWRKIV